MRSSSGHESRSSRDRSSALAPTRWARRLGFAVAVLTGACSPHAPPASEEATGLAIDYGPCAAVVADEETTCVLDGDHLNLWVEHPAAERARLSIDGELTEATRYYRPQLRGVGLRISVPEQAGRVQLTLDDDTPPWSLRIARGGRTPSLLDAQLRIQELVVEGRSELALEQLEQLRSRAPRSTEALDAALSASHLLLQRAADPKGAEALLLDYEALAHRSPLGRAKWLDARATLHWKLGRYDDAAIAYREVGRFALATGDELLELSALSMYANLLVELGYHRAAEHWAHHVETILRDRSYSPNRKGRASRTLGWIGLSLRSVGRDRIDPEPLYRTALELLADDPDHIGGAQLGLARLELESDHVAEALGHLHAIDPTRLTPDERAHALDLEIRAQLRQGAEPEEVSGLLRRLQEVVDIVNTPQARWHLATTRGLAAEATGDVEAAIGHYREAERQHERVLRLAVFGAHRRTTDALRREATQRLVELLAESGRAREASCTAREHRARTMQTLVLPASLLPHQQRELREHIEAYLQRSHELDTMERSGHDLPGRELERIRSEVARERDDLHEWANALTLVRGQRATRPTCDDLPPRRPGELLLGLYPSRQRWVLVVEDDRGANAHLIEDQKVSSSHSPEELSASLLDPVRDRLLRAQRVRVIAHGEAIGLDVHALPFEGLPLVARLPVTYGADVLSTPPPPRDGPPTALLVADTTGSLWAAPTEIRVVDETLSRSGWSTTLPSNLDSLPRALAALGRADLLHYAGHADTPATSSAEGLWPPYPDGASGWPSYLVLEPPTRLATHEILMSRRVPRLVVLHGCRTGVTSGQHVGTSLALAFLAAGSEQVLASSEAIDDVSGAALGSRLYEGATDPSSLDLAVQLHHVMREEAEAGRPVGPLRVWVR